MTICTKCNAEIDRKHTECPVCGCSIEEENTWN